MSKGTGKIFRIGISIKELSESLPEDSTGEAWFAEQRWPDKIEYQLSGSDRELISDSHKLRMFRFKDHRNCDKRFSVKTETVLECVKIGYEDWLIATLTFMLTTSLKSVSPMQLHRDLEITQKPTRFLAHRLRKALAATDNQFMRPVEKKLYANRGAVGKAAIVGARNRDSNEVVAKVVESTSKETLQDFVHDNKELDSVVYTDTASAYNDLSNDYDHKAVNHSIDEHVRRQVDTKGIQSFWATLKKAHKRTFHKLNPAHLQCMYAIFRADAISVGNTSSFK